MIVKIQQAENSVERVENEVITTLYNAHVNGNISQELDNNSQKIGLIGTIQADAGYGNQVSTLTSAYPKFHVSVTNEYLEFEDSKTEAVCAKYFGDGVGCTQAQLAAAYSTWTNQIDNVNFVTALSNAGAKKFNEFQYVQGISELYYGFFGNNTFDEITLPTGSIRITGTIFANDNASTTVHNATSISYMAEFGSNRIKSGYILDFNKYTGRFENNGYGRSEIAYCGNPYIIIPRNSLMNRTSSDNFELNELRNTYTVVFREDFVSNMLYLRGRGNNSYDIPFYTSITSVVFLSTTPPFNGIDLSNNQSIVYVPSSAVSAYTTALNNSNRTVTTLDVFANVSDENKDILVEAGCTATGSTGNWTIKAPGEF